MIIICEWDTWQTYRKDRGQPPWIKVHRRLLRNKKWLSLTEAERGQLLCLWLLAADHDGKIDMEASMIKQLTYMSKPPNLKKFSELGFVAVDDANVTSMWRQDDANMTPQSSTDKSSTEKNRHNYWLFWFNQFWSVFPKKVAKLEAQKAWKTLSPSEKLAEEICKDVVRKTTRPDWQKDNGKFIPHPATYIRGRRWEDECDVKNRSPTREKIETCPKCGGIFVNGKCRCDDLPPEERRVNLDRLNKLTDKIG